MNMALTKSYSKKAVALQTKLKKCENEDATLLEKEAYELSDEIRKESLKQEIEIASKYGYILIDDSQANADTRSVASDLEWASEVVMYHPNSNSYRYTVDWDLHATDSLYDTYDIAGVGITNPDNFDFAGTYGKTFSIYGESCYVDSNGNSSGSQPDTMSKRSEDRNGVAFNINDKSHMYDGFLMCSSGRITVYVKKTPSSSGTQRNKFIASYNHNYKVRNWNPTAIISFVGFSVDATLQVTYTTENKVWQRASGGRSIVA